MIPNCLQPWIFSIKENNSGNMPADDILAGVVCRCGDGCTDLWEPPPLSRSLLHWGIRVGTVLWSITMAIRLYHQFCHQHVSSPDVWHAPFSNHLVSCFTLHCAFIAKIEPKCSVPLNTYKNTMTLPLIQGHINYIVFTTLLPFDERSIKTHW